MTEQQDRDEMSEESIYVDHDEIVELLGSHHCDLPNLRCACGSRISSWADHLANIILASEWLIRQRAKAALISLHDAADDAIKDDSFWDYPTTWLRKRAECFMDPKCTCYVCIDIKYRYRKETE